MTFTLAQQTGWFAGSMLLGLLFGLLLDTATIAEDLLQMGRGGRFLVDVAGYLLCAVLSFVYLLTFLDGELRVYPMLGIALGALLERMTLGTLRKKCTVGCRHLFRRIRAGSGKKPIRHNFGEKDEKRAK